MARLNLPPRVKVLEALGSIADGRVKVVNDSEAEVVSSTGDRRYRVRLDLSSRRVFSNDNGTVYRNYVGYPIIAFLMLKDLVPYDGGLANALKGINWRKLNEAYKNYSLVEKHAKRVLIERGFSEEYIESFINRVLASLKSLSLEKM